MDNDASISVQPISSLIDQRVSILATGLKPGEKVKILASSSDYFRIERKYQIQGRVLKKSNWASWGIFVADENGAIDLSLQKPLAGSYHTADAMGLFWSMTPGNCTPHQLGTKLTDFPLMKSMKVQLCLEAVGRQVASCECTRLFVAEGVAARDVTEDGLVARLLSLPGDLPRPGVIVLGGSDGSIYNAQKLAGALASHGYAALALAYYGMETLPDSLEEIKVEYVSRAAKWMKRQSCVDASHLALFGKSKGAEYALLAGSCLEEDIHAVVSSITSTISFEGLNTLGRTGGKGSWSYQNRTVPFVALDVNGFLFGMKCFWNALRGKPMRVDKEYARAIQNSGKVERAFLPIEKIKGPVLFISASNDYVWPSKAMCEMGDERLKERGFPFSHEHFSYHAGHFIFLPYEPVTMSDVPLEDIAFADMDSWSRILQFLQKNAGASGVALTAPEPTQTFPAA